MRNLIIFAMLSLFLLFPITIYADKILNGDSTTSTTGFDVSKNVSVTYETDTNGVGFTAISNHLSGDTLYGAGSDTTQLFSKKTGKTKGTLNEDLPNAANSTDEFGVSGAYLHSWLPM